MVSLLKMSLSSGIVARGRRSLFSLYLARFQSTNQIFSKSLSSSTSAIVKKTCLYDFHVSKGGKMVPFCGWIMPVQYSDQGIPASHHHTRTHASLFDVSHMLQTKVWGRDSVAFMESLVVGDVAGLADDHGTLTLFTNERGGIVDDLIVNKTSLGHLYIVSNAGRADTDLAHMTERLEDFKRKGKEVNLEIINNGLIALQGPETMKALQPNTDIDLSKLGFMTTTKATVLGVTDCRITRCGYTGEDGVEISVPLERAADMAEQLLTVQTASVRLAGLGARDSLRLEAGLCLYGNDIDETTTPVEAGLVWTIGKIRRQRADFPGADIILRQLKEKPARKRVGVVSTGAPARGGCRILDETGSRQVGHVTSGCPSPSLKKNVAIGYAQTEFSASGQRLKLEVRREKVDAEVVKLPFVPTKYFSVK